MHKILIHEIKLNAFQYFFDTKYAINMKDVITEGNFFNGKCFCKDGFAVIHNFWCITSNANKTSYDEIWFPYAML